MTIEILMALLWLTLAAYSSWFLLKAKTLQPLTLENLAIKWKLHKQETGCTTKRLHSMIKRKNKIIGFKCNCGYEFLQQRLITQRVKKQTITEKLCQ